MTTLRLTPVASQPTRLPDPPAGAPVIIAVDLARTTWKHAVYFDGHIQRTLSTPGALEHLQALVRHYHPAHRVWVVYEACGFGYEIAWWAQASGVDVLVVAPSRVERAPGPRVKTDRLDARMLATKTAARTLKGIAIPPRQQHEDRQLLRTYTQAVRARTRAQVQVRAVLQEHGRIGPPPTSGWRVYTQWLDAQELPPPVARAVAELRTLRATAHLSAHRLVQHLHALAATPRYAAQVAALTSHAGVGELSAMRLLLELGDITRFRRADSLTHFLGLTPSEYSSGDTAPHRGPIRKCGPAGVRANLVQCAWASLRSDAKLRATFDRINARAGRKRAIIAVSRRLAVRLRARWLESLAPPAAAAAS
ncbi:MAG TPA: IS110 family transposase [Nevskiaceae bacterium]|nr:IS110 family transposase [Nevskiaceae bacterium]